MNKIIRNDEEVLWCKNDGFGHLGSGRYISTFANFNTRIQHHIQAYYYAASGYMVKFHKQAVLVSTISCYKDTTKTYYVRYYITLRNINCKPSKCTCGEVDGNVIVYHRNNTVTKYQCETENPIQFQEEFYEPLVKFTKDTIGVGAE